MGKQVANKKNHIEGKKAHSQKPKYKNKAPGFITMFKTNRNTKGRTNIKTSTLAIFDTINYSFGGFVL